MKPQKILIVDDDPLFRQTVSQQLELFGFDVRSAADGAEGERLIHAEDFALVLLDLGLPDTDGLSLLKKWRDQNISASILMISGQGTIPDAVTALKRGAVDFLVKPVDINILEACVNRTLKSIKLQQENKRLKALSQTETVEFLGESRAVKELLNDAQRIAGSSHPVLLEGETGTGKQILAGYIYSNSDRAKEPFVRVNCAAITHTLFESELFGHEKGAFTGAHSRKPGKLELVGSGTLLLDEIGELPQACQAKLLTAVEDRIFERVGGTASLRFEGRIIAATNRDLEREVADGNFRRDFFYRLNTFRLKLPALKDRPEDIPIYVEDTLKKCRRQYGGVYDPPDEKIIEQLSRYNWPGNVRELVHHIERIALFSDGPKIPQKLWLSLPVAADDATSSTETDLQVVLDRYKHQHVMKVLDSCGGNQTKAAKLLGIGRTYLNRLLSTYAREE